MANTDGMKNYMKPGGMPPVFDYRVKVGDGPVIQLDGTRKKYPLPPNADGAWVRIFAGERQWESWRFSLDDYETPDLCLILNSLYETWFVWPASRSPQACAC